MRTLNTIALVLTIIGGLNWGLVGLADLDLVAAIFGAGSTLARLVYIAVGIAAAYCLALLPIVSRDTAPLRR
jgi:uncharacterized membrane protein YuzA (DUF378 family)